jgi:hypothetical protein
VNARNRRFKAALMPITLLAGAPVALGNLGAIVELVPDNAGPYTGGETVQVDVCFHNEESFLLPLQVAQIDFTDTDPGLNLGPSFT